MAGTNQMIIQDDRERGGGAVSAPMAIAALALLAAIGLGIDGVRAAQGLATADAVAEEAARAAGQALDVDELRRGSSVVDPAAAVAAAQAHLAAAGVDGTVTVVAPQRIRVEARITQPTVLLGLVGRTEITSSGAAEAVLVAVQPSGDPP
jgi:Flp pilus assembly protein TadG